MLERTRKLQLMGQVSKLQKVSSSAFLASPNAQTVPAFLLDNTPKAHSTPPCRLKSPENPQGCWSPNSGMLRWEHSFSWQYWLAFAFLHCFCAAKFMCAPLSAQSVWWEGSAPGGDSKGSSGCSRATPKGLKHLFGLTLGLERALPLFLSIA